MRRNTRASTAPRVAGARRDQPDGVVLFGVGSAVVGDVEETLARLGVPVLAAVQNVPGPVHLLDRAALVDVDRLPAQVLAAPFLVPLFTPAYRQRAVDEARRAGFGSAATVLDPTAIRPRALICGEGVYVNAGCTIGAAARFGPFVFVNRAASIGHDADLGAFVSIGPGAVLAGGVSVRRGAVIGAGATVLPGVTVGENAVVGAGATVVADVPDRCVVAGGPARVVRTAVAGYNEAGVS